MRKLIRIVLFFIVLLPVILFAQEDFSNLDELFESPVNDVIETPPTAGMEIDHTENFNIRNSLGLSGKYSATGGIELGLKESGYTENPISNVDGSFLALSSLALNLDIRPDPDLRVYGSFSVALKPSSGNYSWSTIAVDELFCDYTLLSKAFIRFGKHTIAWGQGYLYTPGNLMAGSEDGTAFRISLPTLLSGVSFVTLAQSGFFADPAAPSITEFAYGALADAVLGKLRTSLGIRYRKPEGYRVLASLKTTVFSTDLFCDVVGHYDTEEAMGVITLFGFYRQWKDLTVYGEWQHSYVESGTSDAVGVAVAYNNLANTTVDLGIKWLHTLQSVSGAVAIGFSWDPFNSVKTTIALPFIYGEEGRYDILNEGMPLTQRISLVLLAKISTSF